MTESDSADARLLTPADVRRLAAQLGIRPTKTLGQNFVIDPGTVRRIVRAAQVSPDDVVVEVGPGLGSLTLALLPHVRHVTAVEIDPRLAEALPGTVADHAPAYAHRLRVVTADALRITELPDPQPTALVANLPYNVAVPVVLHLLNLLPSLEHGLVMVQAEVAERLAARPGDRAYGARQRRSPGMPTSAGPGRSAAPCSGRCPTSTPVWSRCGAVPHPHESQPRRRLRCRRRGVRAAPQNPARCPQLLGGLGRGRRGCAAQCGRGPAEPR